jgi:DNA-binding NtrC family response regulator
LRERDGDIPYLFDVLMQRLHASYAGRHLTLTTEARDKLIRYAWPGNVRELQNVVESLLALANTDTITVHDLPLKIRMAEGSNIQVQPREEPTLGEAVPLPFQDAERLFEREILLNALRQANFVQSRAADLLGISRRMLKYKMDKLGIVAGSRAGKGGSGDQHS